MCTTSAGCHKNIAHIVDEIILEMFGAREMCGVVEDVSHGFSKPPFLV